MRRPSKPRLTIACTSGWAASSPSRRLWITSATPSSKSDRRPEVQEPAAAGMAHQEPGTAARPQVHADTVGRRGFRWPSQVHGHQARLDTARPRGGAPELRISPAEFDEVAAELGRSLDFAKVPKPKRQNPGSLCRSQRRSYCGLRRRQKTELKRPACRILDSPARQAGRDGWLATYTYPSLVAASTRLAIRAPRRGRGVISSASQKTKRGSKPPSVATELAFRKPWVSKSEPNGLDLVRFPRSWRRIYLCAGAF